MTSTMTRRLLILVVLLVWPHVVLAADEPASVRLLVGRSAVVDVGTPITRVSLTSADVADALVTAPDELLVNGKTPGTVSMFVWERNGNIRRYEVVVQRDLSRLAEQVQTFFPDEHIAVEGNGRNVVLSGTVTNKDVIEKAVDLASGYVDKRDEVVTLLQIQDGAPSNQVLLRVRFAEVSRSALTELGASFFTSPTGVKNTIGRVTTQQFAAPGYDALSYSKASGDFGAPVTGADGKITFSDFLNLFLFNEKYDLGAMIRLLQTRGLFQSLAEPNLVAESGKEASFLAGGEIPVPIAQGTGGNVAISVQYKEFGIRLNFTPVVNGDRVHLKVRPEVSSLDFNNAVVIQGFRIPALSTRRTETELELRDGQTFAIAGLLNNTMMESMSKVPGLGDIPILGYLFRSKAAQKDRTELVVMITPEILPNNSPGVTNELPRQREPYLPPLRDNQSVAPPPAAFPPSAVRPQSSVSPQGAADGGQASGKAAAAAAAVAALGPRSPQVVTATPAPAPAAADPLPAVPLDTDGQAATPTPTPDTVHPLTADEIDRIEQAQESGADAATEAAPTEPK
jgi:pilus assembly protein CpaC